MAIRRQEALGLLATERAERRLDGLDRRALGPDRNDIGGGAISAAMPPRPAAPCGEPLPEELFADGYEVPD